MHAGNGCQRHDIEEWCRAPASFAKESDMSQYQFYLLNSADRDVDQQMHRCQDDHAAVQLARSICFDNNIDIWQGARRVARVGKSDFAVIARL